MGLTLDLRKTAVEGCFTFVHDLFKDHRGTYCEAFNESEFARLGLPTRWPQDSISTSVKGTLRGLHLLSKDPQGKLVRCLQGRIMDVCLDVRPDSPSFGVYVAVELSHGQGIYCPPGTAHGFFAYEDSAVYYKCTTIYDKAYDGGINPMDPELRIPWPDVLNISSKDHSLPSFVDYVREHHGRRL